MLLIHKGERYKEHILSVGPQLYPSIWAGLLFLLAVGRMRRLLYR
jgi:hypothetical protein